MDAHVPDPLAVQDLLLRLANFLIKAQGDPKAVKKQGRYHYFGVDWPGESFSESATLCGIEGEDVGTGQTLCPDCVPREPSP